MRHRGQRQVAFCRCRGTGRGPVPAGHLYLDGDPVGQPGIQGRQDPGKHQADELGRPVLMHVADVRTAQQLAMFASLPPLGIVALMSVNVIVPTLGLALGLAAALPIIDLL